MIVLGLLIAGWVVGVYLPPRSAIGTIDGRQILLSDLVPYTRLDGNVTGYLQPKASLNNLGRDRLMEAAGSEIGVSVGQEDVEQRIKDLFELPDADAGDASSGSTTRMYGRNLTDFGQKNLDDFLSLIQVEESSYRSWLRGQMYGEQIFQHFSGQLTAQVDQVYVRWIVASDSVAAQEAFDRVKQGQPFGEVSADLNRDTVFSDSKGLVGWVPEGAFVELDEFLFPSGDELLLEEPIGPIATSLGSVVMVPSAGPRSRSLSPQMAGLLARRDFQSWLDVQTSKIVQDLELPEDAAAWVLDQLQ